MTSTTSFQTSELDFDTIKNNLKTYFKQSGQFNDYDFEASGLSNILDVLAYNTHYNALITNFGLNEAYLTSAQLRSSVVSIAQTLGYDIRSKTASIANLGLSLNLSAAGIKPTSITLPAGTKFTSEIDGVAYTFQTIASYVATDDGSGIFTFIGNDGSENIPVYEGTFKRKTFIVQEEDERQIFVIPDENLDTTTAVVKVYDTYNSTPFLSYVDIKDTTNIDENSRFFKLFESPNGYYELTFGDGITLGAAPVVGNKVEIEYLSTSGAVANGGVSFTPTSQITVNSVDYDLIVTVNSVSAGGSEKQSIESIRQNAPLGFAAQKRLVTAEDYKSSIISKYSTISDVTAWGGEDNDPPNYGNVYVSLLFQDNVSESNKELIKTEITDDINENLAILSIDNIFVDPEITYLELETFFNFNPNKTSVTQNTLESNVQAQVLSYVNDNLKKFTGIFRKSNLLTQIDEISPSILSTAVNVKIQRRLTPVTTATVDDDSVSSSYNLSFPVALAAPDDNVYTITSSTFIYNGVNCTIKNKLNTTKLQVVNANSEPVVDNIGSYEAETGKINIVGFAPGIITSGDTFIKVSALPASESVLKPLRNFYFDIDESKSFSSAVIDKETVQIKL